MAKSKIELANIALSSYLGHQRITNIEEDTPEAEQVELHFDAVRREMLSEWDWAFAIRRERLAKIAENDRPEWGSKFARPNNVLRIRWVADPNDAKQGVIAGRISDTPREVVGGFIYSDLDTATVEVIEDQEDVTLWPPKFDAAFSALLASRMAIPLTETASKAESAISAYTDYMDAAKVENQMQNPPVIVENAGRQLGVEVR